jgi:hypothetical protein
VHETSEDIRRLQELIDASFATGGRHLLSILDPARRVTAEELVERLTGMRLLVLSTVTADGRPIGGPVDGIFYRGAFHFGTSPDSIRWRHLRTRPHVTATHLPGEEFAATVHGQAVSIDIRAPEGAGLRQTLLDVYVPRYGEQFETQFLDGGERPPVYVRIEATRMFTFQMR